MKNNIDFLKIELNNKKIIIKLEAIENILISSKFVSKIDSQLITPSPFLNYVKKEIKEYFEDKRKEFSFNIKLSGTTKEKEVYRSILKISHGNLKTYKEIAENINNPNASRFIGNTMKKNNLIIIVPCHRVIPSNNKDYGRYIYGKELKKILIENEKQSI